MFLLLTSDATAMIPAAKHRRRSRTRSWHDASERAIPAFEHTTKQETNGENDGAKVGRQRGASFRSCGEAVWVCSKRRRNAGPEKAMLVCG